LSDNAQFVATTGPDGRYEFPPLRPDTYKLTVDPIGPFQPDQEKIDVRPGACWDLTLASHPHPHARITGHVRYSDGSQAAGIGVLLIKGNGTWSISNADSHGYFRLDSLDPGEYIVGVNLPSAPPWKYGAAGSGDAPPALRYYPNTPDRASAISVTLSKDEKRDDIDVIVPTQ
jgi:hypothetical protein